VTKEAPAQAGKKAPDADEGDEKPAQAGKKAPDADEGHTDADKKEQKADKNAKGEPVPVNTQDSATLSNNDPDKESAAGGGAKAPDAGEGDTDADKKEEKADKDAKGEGDTDAAKKEEKADEGAKGEPKSALCKDSDSCLHKKGWSWMGYTCSGSKSYCTSHTQAMKCCPATCGTCKTVVLQEQPASWSRTNTAVLVDDSSHDSWQETSADQW